MATTRRKTKKSPITNDVLHVGYVLDASGSMRGATTATKEAVEQYILDLRAEEAKIIKKFGSPMPDTSAYTYLTITAFANSSYPLLETSGIDQFDLNAVVDRYNATGGTALYDAIADTILQMEQIVQEDEKVLIAILTDGGENSSRRYNSWAIRQMIEGKEEAGWTFTWLGAGMRQEQVVAAAAAIGINQGSVAVFDTTSDSYTQTSVAFASMSGMLRSAANTNEVKAINADLYTNTVGTNDFTDSGTDSGTD